MKKTLLFALVLGSFFCLKAQEGEILYTDFEPDNCIDHPYSLEPHPIEIDFDQDGTIDVRINDWITSPEVAYLVFGINQDWESRILNGNNPNDTIIPSDEFDWVQGPWPPDDPIFSISHSAFHADRIYGFRILKDGMYYYAWMDFYVDRTSISQVSVCVDRYAYCTIPDYPLHWGQTSLNWSVEENTEVSTSIHPNPATDFITIDLPNEEDCQSIEIFSIDGRLVETFPETSHQTTIDISGLNTGMYIMKLRMTDGREFAEKIVKE